jgi:ligand-binding sensor domain-containing protein
MMVTRLTYRFRISALMMLLAALANGQEKDYSIQTYTTASGLPHDRVTSIVQDKSGFLWIGTWDGLSRFDGYDFKNYYHDPWDSTSLATFDILGLCIDRDNNLWILMPNSLDRYDRTGDSFLHYNFERDDSLHIGSEGVTWMDMDGEGNLYASGSNGIDVYDYPSHRFIHYNISGDYLSHTEVVPPFILDNRGGYWLLFKAGRMISMANCRFDREKKNFVPGSLVSGLEIPEHSTQTFINSDKIILDTLGRIWFVSHLGIYEVDTLNRAFIHRRVDEVRNEIGKCLPIWAGESRLFINTRGSRALMEVPLNEIGSPLCMFEDAASNIWMGVVRENEEGVGLIRLSFSARFFRNLTDFKANPAVFAVLKNKDKELWLGTKEHFYPLRIDARGKWTQLAGPPVERRMRSYIRAFVEEENGIWIGYHDDHLLWYDYRKKKYDIAYPPARGNDEQVPVITFKLLNKYSEKYLVSGGSMQSPGMIYIFNPYDFDEVRQKKALNVGDIFSLLIEKNGLIWAGGRDHLFCLNENLDILSDLEIKSTNIESIYKGGPDNLWLALMGKGIGNYNLKTGEVKIYSTREGLQNITTYNILMDKRGNIWVSTNEGISMFNPQTDRFRNFDESDGLYISEFNADAVWQGKDGEIIFGGMGGVVSFYPDSLMDETRAAYAPLLITEIKLDGMPFLPGIYQSNRIRLDKGQDNFQLSFAKLDFVNPDKIIYRYKVREVDKDWILADHRKKSANYINLKPRTYHFIVQATDGMGKWADQTTLEIQIPPYYYQTVLFKIFLGLLGVAFLALFFYLHVRQVRLRSEREKDRLRHQGLISREQLKLESLRGQLNPHLIFNSLNSVNLFIMENNPMKANQFLTDFSNLIRAFLENSKHEYIPLQKEIDLLEQYIKIEQVRFGDRFTYSIDQSRLDDWYVEVSPSMAQPFVENAIWHGIGKLPAGQKGHIRLAYEQGKAGCIICYIEDNGVGIKKSYLQKSTQQRKRTSRGTGIITERLVLINSIRNSDYTLSFEDLMPGQENPGTRVRIEIPVKPDHESGQDDAE